MIKIFIQGGFNKFGEAETVNHLTLESGNVYSIVGNTGSGKTQLIEDIESLIDGDGVTGRCVSLIEANTSVHIAHLSQNMNFILDLSVEDFIKKRLHSRPHNITPDRLLTYANSLCGEEIINTNLLTRLSGGQSRALMIADIAFNSIAEIILIDEIENAGIDKIKAMSLLIDQHKLVLVITHDPLLALYGHQRLIMKNGGIDKIVHRTEHETHLMMELHHQHTLMESIRNDIRKGNIIDYPLQKEALYDNKTLLE